MGKYKYSFLQPVMWAIAGCEVWLMKDCPTAYKYYSRQGLVFTMTFCFAAFCGGCAGLEFGDTWQITILFGLIWGLLIYSIDQMMVQTIDKVYVNTLSVWKKVFKYLFLRLFLGILLALFMSSPLDHFLFEGQIAAQMHIDADSTLVRYKRELPKIMDIDGTSKELERFQSKRDSLDRAKTQEPNTVVFLEAKNNYDNEFPVLKQLGIDKNKKEIDMQLLETKIPEQYDTVRHENVWITTSPEYYAYAAKRIESNNAKTAWENKDAEVREYKDIMKEEIKQYETDLENKIKIQDTLVDKSEKRLFSDREVIKTKEDEREVFLKQLQGFDTKFMTLLTHPSFGVQFLRWLVFLVFLGIEILPTWLKLMGKPTEYDIKLDEEKKTRIKAFKDKKQDEYGKAEIKRQSDTKILIAQEEQRHNTEIENHRKILEMIAEKQYNIAQMILNEWEKQTKKI